VPEGSIYAFLGPNGAGKTTTIKTLLHLLEPTAGVSRVLGVDSTRIGPRELAQIGYVSENQQLPEWMTVAELAAYCRPMYPTWDDAFYRRLLSEFALPADRKLKHLSRGMKMKAALLVSLAYRPRLLILDEPFSGLDPLMRDEFARGILELSEQENWTVFLSSHDIDEVERLADWVGIIDGGSLHLSESTEALQARFRSVALTGAAGLPGQGQLPPEWLTAEASGATVRFVESRYRPGATEAEIARLFPDAGPPEIAPLSLRDIFLTLAKTFRISPSTT
jgi:ABC-2 type transport system ATP-binding protein